MLNFYDTIFRSDEPEREVRRRQEKNQPVKTVKEIQTLLSYVCDMIFTILIYDFYI